MRLQSRTSTSALAQKLCATCEEALQAQLVAQLRAQAVPSDFLALKQSLLPGRRRAGRRARSPVRVVESTVESA